MIRRPYSFNVERINTGAIPQTTHQTPTTDPPQTSETPHAEPMNLRNKLTRMENELTAHHANPFVEGTHAHFVRLSWGADSDATPTQWIENTTTGERYEVTPEWQRLLNAYHDHHVQTIRPRFVWSLAPTPNQEPNQ